MGGVRKGIPTEKQPGSTSTQVRLRGRMLLVARGVWFAFALFLLILWSVNLLQPLYGGQTVICPLTFTCPFDMPTLQALQQTHIALPIYTIYTTAFGLFFSLIFVGLSVLLFRRVFDQLVGLLACFSFLLLGSTSLVPNFSNMPFTLQVFGGVIQPLLQTKWVIFGLTCAVLLFLLVFAGQTLLSSMLGHNNGLLIVGSTLIVAALFQPLRRRIQRVIDRRFYRRKYDAQKTLAAFSATLRGEVDLEQLREHLLAVVEETMQLAHVSLWLRTPQPSAQQQRVSTNSPQEP